MKTAACFGAIGLIILLSSTTYAEAPIARIPTIDQNQNDPDTQAGFKDGQQRGGQIINLQLLLGVAPKFARAHQQLAYAMRFDAVTPRKLRELAIVRTLQIMDGKYEMSQHIPMMKACGYAESQIAALANWRTSTLFGETDRAELAYVEQVVDHGRVDDATFKAFSSHFSPKEIIEITMIVGAYAGTSMLTNALELKIDDDGHVPAFGKC